MADITTEHILATLQPIWLEKPETASRTRGRIQAVLDAARARRTSRFVRLNNANSDLEKHPMLRITAFVIAITASGLGISEAGSACGSFGNVGVEGIAD